MGRLPGVITLDQQATPVVRFRAAPGAITAQTPSQVRLDLDHTKKTEHRIPRAVQVPVAVLTLRSRSQLTVAAVSSEEI